ncbi:hypothetical protein K8D42_19095, partial [Citrobacter portucalensis]|uniref:hypothetical protein n=1 Tax=Citrobacter portucalensis TaxID=1639133 RepID=UPI00338E82D1|nr:hypothetical protein [Citrobacter portucalensis]MCO4156009.1 hypothetical protein [Citrobacter portucalensis]
KTGFTHSDLLCWQSDYAGGSLNVNGTIMRDTYMLSLITIKRPMQKHQPVYVLDVNYWNY